MKRLIIASILLLAPALAPASGGGGVHLEDADIDLADKESLQRGAKYFVSYCMGCHSLKYMRYNRMGKDLGLDEVQVRQDFIFTNAKPGDLMEGSMRPKDAEKWFGTAVPDLTLVTRWRSSDWLYTYLKSFYQDEERPYGFNNAVFPDVGMPHVLAGLQGVQKAVFAESEDEGHGPVEGFEMVHPGSMSPEEYDRMVLDLTNFLTYAGEPMKLERQRLGVYVLLFLGLFFVLAYLLKKEYWKDVH
jgi:ubiquinol-cytochrome c reductase cytochrome c1 subunit